MRAEASRRRLPGWVARAVPPVDAGLHGGCRRQRGLPGARPHRRLRQRRPRRRHRPAGEARPDRLRRPCGAVGARRRPHPRRPAAARAAGRADRLRLPAHGLRRCGGQLPRPCARAGSGTASGRSSTRVALGCWAGTGAQKTLAVGARLAACGAAGRRSPRSAAAPCATSSCAGCPASWEATPCTRRLRARQRRHAGPAHAAWASRTAGSIAGARRGRGTVPARPVAGMDPARAPTPGPRPWCRGRYPGERLRRHVLPRPRLPTDACATPARTTEPRPTPNEGAAMTAAPSVPDTVLADLERPRGWQEDLLPRPAPAPRAVPPGARAPPRGVVAAAARDAGYEVHGRRRRHRRGRHPAQRRRPDRAAPRRHGRAPGQGGHRPAVRQHGDRDRRRRDRGAGDARLRTRRARHLPARRGRAARRAPGPVAAAPWSPCSSRPRSSATGRAAMVEDGARRARRPARRRLGPARPAAPAGVGRHPRRPGPLGRRQHARSPCTVAVPTARCRRPRSTPSCWPR